MGLYDVEIKEIYRCIATVQADCEVGAIEMVKKLCDDGLIELDSENITETEYSIVGRG